MSGDYPRVLIVTSDDIAADSATGITLRNLFGAWPTDRLAQAHLSSSSGEHAIERHQIPPSTAPIDALVRRAAQRKRVAFADRAPRIAAVPLEDGATKAARRHAAARAALDLSPILPSRSTREFVRRFSPDLVYSLLGSSRVIRVSTDLARRHRVPLIPHFMDDWPATLYSSGELGGVARSRVVVHLDRALARAPLALCISDQMCREYQARYGLECHTFVNPVEIPPVRTVESSSGCIELVYAGGLHLGRWSSLVLVAEALSRLEGRARLLVYAPERDLQGLAVPHALAEQLVIGGSLPPEDVADRLRAADVLVHVESFDETTSRYTQFSLSTKVPQYLAAGRPIVAVGPEWLASLQVIVNSGGGIVVGSRDPDAIATATRDLLSDPTTRAALGSRGREYAVATFSQEAVRGRLRDVLASVARS